MFPSTGAGVSSPVGCAGFCRGKPPENSIWHFSKRSKTNVHNLWFFTWPVICFLGWREAATLATTSSLLISLPFFTTSATFTKSFPPLESVEPHTAASSTSVIASNTSSTSKGLKKALSTWDIWVGHWWVSDQSSTFNMSFARETK